MTKILRLNAGANHADSVSRPLATALINGLAEKGAVDVTDVEFIDASRLAIDAEQSVRDAHTQITSLLAA